MVCRGPPPVSMKTLNSPNGKVGGQPNGLKPGAEEEVAAWMVDLVKWLEIEGVPLPYGISPQNEPDFGPPDYPGCIYTAKQIQATTIALRKALDAAGYSQIKVLADEGAKEVDGGHPKSNPNSGTVNMLGLHPGGAFHTNVAFRDALDIIATHTYDLHNKLYQSKQGALQEWHDATKDTGKELWMTEWETRHEHTFNDWEVISETLSHFNRDISSMGFNAWFPWQIWQGHLLSKGTSDPGQCLSRIRPGDIQIYKGVELGKNPEFMDLRISANTNKVKLTIHMDSADGPVLGELDIPKTTRSNRDFQTIRIPLQLAEGTRNLYFAFTCPEHWHETDLNWFQIANQQVVEAESFAEQVRTERWSSQVAGCYFSSDRRLFIHDDGIALQKRPIFYIFKKLWANAPADGKTHVRRVTSSDDRLQGESKTAKSDNFRQDFSAFVHEGRTTLVLLNRVEQDLVVQVHGLTGKTANIYRYTQAEAELVNQDLTELEPSPIHEGSISSMTLPAKTLTIIVTE